MSDGKPVDEVLTLRDYFAAFALEGLIATNGGPLGADQSRTRAVRQLARPTWAWMVLDESAAAIDLEPAARLAYQLADAMIRAREKP